jgi:hypothetical protein
MNMFPLVNISSSNSYYEISDAGANESESGTSDSDWKPPARNWVNAKMTAFWNMMPCSIVEVDRHFRGVYCLHHQDIISEMSVYFYKTA